MCEEFNDFDDMSFIIKLIGTKKIETQPLEFINDEINKNAKHNKVSDEIITKLKNNTAISYYYMYSYSSDLNKEFFDALKGNGSLTTLFLCINSSFNINPLINVFKSNLSNIQNLNLSRNEIINIDNLCYALKENTSLTYLNLSWNNINDITVLCNYLEDNKNLKILNISHNKFTDIDCFKDVLIHNKCLEELNIGYNDICVNN